MTAGGKDKILLVDDEPNVLAGYRRGLRNRFDVHTAESGDRGLEVIEKEGPFCVVVADMRMPGMDGVQFLKKVKRLAPDTVRMMLTGNADQETAMNAVNQGNIFRFLTKPCPSETLIAALALGVRQYKLVIAEKEVLEQTLSGSIKVLSEMLSLTEPDLFARAEKLRHMAQVVARGLDLENRWELETAALLAPLGVLTLPPELRAKSAAGESLSAAERAALQEVPEQSARLLAHIPRVDNVARIIAQSGMFAEEAPVPPLEKQPKEVRIMRILDRLITGQDDGASLDEMRSYLLRQSQIFDADLVTRITQVLDAGFVAGAPSDRELVEVRAKELIHGDILAQNVLALDDRLLLSKGTEITPVYLARLHNYRRLVGIQEPLKVLRKKIAV